MSAKAQQTLKAEVDDKLDQALRDSFPASDPVSFIEPAPGEGRRPKIARREGGRARQGRPRRKRQSNPFLICPLVGNSPGRFRMVDSRRIGAAEEEYAPKRASPPATGFPKPASRSRSSASSPRPKGSMLAA